MLRNEKYVGDTIFQKTFTDSSYKRHYNYGEEDSYMISDDHEPIISRDVFKKAEELLKINGEEKALIAGEDKYNRKHTFTGRIICGECGGPFHRRTHCSGTPEIAWCCKTHIDNISACSMKYLRDDSLKAAYITMINKLIFSHKTILQPLFNRYRRYNSSYGAELQGLNKELRNNLERRDVLKVLRAEGVMDNATFTLESNRLCKEADEYRRKIKQLETSETDEAVMKTETEKILCFAETSDYIEEFSPMLFEMFAEGIIVKERRKIAFVLKCGLTLEEEII